MSLIQSYFPLPMTITLTLESDIELSPPIQSQLESRDAHIFQLSEQPTDLVSALGNIALLTEEHACIKTVAVNGVTVVDKGLDYAR